MLKPTDVAQLVRSVAVLAPSPNAPDRYTAYAPRSQLQVVDGRLRQTRIGDPRDTDIGLRAVSGPRTGPNVWQEQYYAWRASLVHHVGADYGRQLDDIGSSRSFLGKAFGRPLRRPIPQRLRCWRWRLTPSSSVPRS